MPDNPFCKRCGGPTHYAGNVTAPNQMIYGCDKCGHQTWVRVDRAQLQQQPQSDEKKD